MAFNNDLPWQSSMLVEQVLIEGKMPFDIIFDENLLKNLDRYKVLEGFPLIRNAYVTSKRQRFGNMCAGAGH